LTAPFVDLTFFSRPMTSPLHLHLLRRIWSACAVAALAIGLLACGNEGTESPDAAADEDRAQWTTVPDTASIWSVLQTDERFSTLVAVLDSTGLDSLLARGGPYTLFAPTNTAFRRLPEGTVDDLLAERRDRLRTILRYHLLPTRVRAADVTGPDTLATLAGPDLPLRRTDTTLTAGDGVPILRADVETANGIIHVLDGVLRPPEP
jgi:uncharacterized surface protein with fasciclin (FAS1) repeats